MAEIKAYVVMDMYKNTKEVENLEALESAPGDGIFFDPVPVQSSNDLSMMIIVLHMHG